MFVEELGGLVRSGKRCHLIGIGGISMSPLAEVLHGMGVSISGSDINDGQSVRKLRALGIDIVIGHYAENIQGAGYIVRTAAVGEDNAEIAAARQKGIPVFERAQAWGLIMREYSNAICVAGVHGKTTTTSMITHILLASGVDPTVMIGGNLPILGSGYRLGKGDVIVLESCEYFNSFHNFFPTIALVLNVDADHLDFFRDIGDLISSFRKFASLVPEGGKIVCNSDDANTMEALNPLGRELFTFGLGKLARVRGVKLKPGGRNPSLEVLFDGKPFCSISLKVPGMYNLRNALAATACAIAFGVPADKVEQGLSEFTGLGRRFEYKGSFNGADVYDDYAHHPSELRAVLDAVSTLGYKRTILIFQPHTFSRTRALFSDFVSELSRADVTFLAEIYSAREKNDLGVSSAELANAVECAKYCPSFSDIAKEVAAMAREGDLVLTVGAGDAYKVGEMLL